MAIQTINFCAILCLKIFRMQTASITEIKRALQYSESDNRLEFLLRLARFKKENKELLHYLLFEAEDENRFIERVNSDISTGLESIPVTTPYREKKAVQAVLRLANRQIKYSGKPATKVEILLHFCRELKGFRAYTKGNTQIVKTFESQLKKIESEIPKLHPDLQYDYEVALKKVLSDF